MVDITCKGKYKEVLFEVTRDSEQKGGSSRISVTRGDEKKNIQSSTKTTNDYGKVVP